MQRQLMKIGIIVFLLFYAAKSMWDFSRNTVINIDEPIFLDREIFFKWYVNGDIAREEWFDDLSYDVPKFMELFYGYVLSSNTEIDSQKYLTKLGVGEEDWNILSEIIDTSSENNKLSSSLFFFILLRKSFSSWGSEKRYRN
jgi:hypothetical protein